jgi:hypothetical protein
MAYAPLDQAARLTIDARMNLNRLYDYGLDDDFSKLTTKLNSPDVLAFDFTIDVIWATATPNRFFLDDCIDATT